MVYQKTDKVLEHMAAQKEKIIDAGADIIARDGELNVENIARRAKMSVGNLYKYFANVDDLRVSIVHRFSRDHMREMVETETPLIDAMTVFYNLLCDSDPRLVKFLRSNPSYIEAITSALEVQFRAFAPEYAPREARLLAGIALGALFGAYDVTDGSKKHAQEAVLFVLRGLGIPRRIQAKFAE